MKRILHCVLFSSVATLCGCISFEQDVAGECSRGPEPELSAFECRSSIENYVEAETDFDAVVVFRNGELVMKWGAYDRAMNSASVRKSVISVLYGIAAERGLVDPDASLEEIEVGDSKQPLTETEKSATIRDLLQARSGVYLDSIGLPESWREVRPSRGAYDPGEYWYYNNWDFNALATIFEKTTGLSVGEAIAEWLAEPLQMQTFCSDHVTYESADYTEHEMWRVYISALDLGLIGNMMAQRGTYESEQIVAESWAEASFESYSEVREVRSDLDYSGYGYPWWLDGDTNTVWADGSGGQFMIINPQTGTVVVTRNNTGQSIPGRVWNGIDGDGRVSHQIAQSIYEKVEECP